MTESMKSDVALGECLDAERAVAISPSFAVPSNRYSDLFGLWPPELFEGFEEFVKRSRARSANRRGAPSWW
jgi:hypothetical protein